MGAWIAVKNHFCQIKGDVLRACQTTVQNVCQRVSGLYHLIKTGKLIAIRQDGQTLLSKAALESFLSAVCPICGEPFRKGNQRQRFCSQSCRQKANRSGRS